MYANYRQIPYHISREYKFKGNSVKSLQLEEHTFENNSIIRHEIYEVWSYNKVILKMIDHKIAYFDNTYYSRTTSRIQNIIKRMYALPKERKKYVFNFSPDNLFEIYEQQKGILK